MGKSGVITKKDTGKDNEAYRTVSDGNSSC